MRWLMSLRDARGAAATVFVLFIGSGVLIGLFAMTADAGALYRERRVTQTAADASSLAVASLCALGSPACATQGILENKAQEFANLNSDDGVSALQNLCGYIPMSPCSNQSTVSCKDVPANLPRYGRVVVTTLNKDLSTKINSPFLSLILSPSSTSMTAKACSQSAWGKANSANIPVPLAITICDYLTDGYKMIQEYNAQLPSCPITIKDVQDIALNPQPTNVINGWSMFRPLGQQLLCLITSRVTVGDVLETLPPGQESCKDASLSGSASKTYLQTFIAANLKKKIFIPVIAHTSGTGTGNAQIVSSNSVGFFYFIFLGYDFGSNQKGGCGDATYRVNEAECLNFTQKDFSDCSNSNKRGCIWGRFTKGIVPGAVVSRDTSFPPVGAQAVELLP